MGMVVEINQRPIRNEIFPSALAAGKQKGNISDLLGQNIDGAIYPDHLLIRIGEDRSGGGQVRALQPGVRIRAERFADDRLGSRRARNVKAKKVHGVNYVKGLIELMAGPSDFGFLFITPPSPTPVPCPSPHAVAALWPRTDRNGCRRF